jgi:hypothetical protein
MKDEYYKKVYIRSQYDFPTDSQFYITHDKTTGLISLLNGKERLCYWEEIDWYLLPVAPQETIREELIKFAKQYNRDHESSFIIFDYIGVYLANRPEATPSAKPSDEESINPLTSGLKGILTEFTENINSYNELKETGNSKGEHKEFYRGKWEAYRRAETVLLRLLKWHSII